MGCDIHAFTEVKRGGKWVEADLWCTNPEYATADEEEKKYTNPMYVPYGTHICIDDRNYALFGVLAGVRGSGLPRISEPKGLPEDASPNVAEDARRWGIDGHSHSWLTLKELKEFNWDYYHNITAYFDPRHFYLNQCKGLRIPGDIPEYWRDGAYGNVISFEEFHQRLDEFLQKELNLSKEEYQVQKSVGSLPHNKIIDLLHDPNRQHKLRFSVRHEFKLPLKWYCSKFVDNTIPALKKLAAQPDVEDVRIVFWFDI